MLFFPLFPLIGAKSELRNPASSEQEDIFLASQSLAKEKTLRSLLVPLKMFPFLQQLWLYLCSPPETGLISNYLSFLGISASFVFKQIGDNTHLCAIMAILISLPLTQHLSYTTYCISTYLLDHFILYSFLQDENSMHILISAFALTSCTLRPRSGPVWVPCNFMKCMAARIDEQM